MTVQTTDAVDADAIFFNGKIATQHDKRSFATATARTSQGNDREMMRYTHSSTRCIDLQGRIVFPGVNDSHLHVIRGGLNFNMELRWGGVPSLADALDMLRRRGGVHGAVRHWKSSMRLRWTPPCSSLHRYDSAARGWLHEGSLESGKEIEDFAKWEKMTKPGVGDEFLRMSGAGERPVFSAADIEDFLEPSPALPATLESERAAVVKQFVQNRWPFRLHAVSDESISHLLHVFEQVNREVPLDSLRWIFAPRETISGIPFAQVQMRTPDAQAGSAPRVVGGKPTSPCNKDQYWWRYALLLGFTAAAQRRKLRLAITFPWTSAKPRRNRCDMVRSLVAVFVAAALNGEATAQSSVTLSGSLDNGLTYINNDGGHHHVKIDSGASLPNFWTLSGKEDLGGGNVALFELSSNFDLNNGQTRAPNTIFGRRAWVGLQTSYGTVSLGKQWDFTGEFFNQFNVSVLGTGYGIHLGDLDRTNNDRLTNSVKYVSPTLWGGFSFGAMYGFRSPGQGIHDGSGWSAGAQYVNGPLAMAVAYTFVANPVLDPYAQTGTHTFLGVPVATVVDNTATVLEPSLQIDSLGTLGVGASYAIGNLTLYGNFTNTALKNPGKKSFMRVYEGGVTYQMTLDVMVFGGYQHTTFEDHAWNQVSAGVLYFLSKRTNLYLASDYIKASAGVDPVLGAATFAPSLSREQAAVRVGIHTFF
ncbi:hypothetical protein LMG28614_05706 [Paraburkholderia ultramafica]|uniref:Amidohydrolase 3 domain-containing protein n=1 Tax=Paraburkholderia ultramafica TaxID=1544867 RepID=A0A6S7C7M8_9BURK|nr:porin [Paraburkholderia ultramafica]CAB3802941.1 hypothetical protein LMG28614_05706 [Paraburkholderia ultramafica]